MEKRTQIDPITKKRVVEITDTKQVKTRLDEDRLLNQKTYLEDSIAKFQKELDNVNSKLNEFS